jgi:uncharacterized protein
MILVDTGPLVALFDPADAWHQRCVDRLAGIRDSIVTTVPVLTEAIHLLTPASIGSQRLLDFIVDGGMGVWFLDDVTLARAFELLLTYADEPMDFADASLVVAAERIGTRKIFTIDRRDFDVYRIKKGHRHLAFEQVG